MDPRKHQGFPSPLRQLVSRPSQPHRNLPLALDASLLHRMVSQSSSRRRRPTSTDLQELFAVAIHLVCRRKTTFGFSNCLHCDGCLNLHFVLVTLLSQQSDQTWSLVKDDCHAFCCCIKLCPHSSELPTCRFRPDGASCGNLNSDICNG